MPFRLFILACCLFAGSVIPALSQAQKAQQKVRQQARSQAQLSPIEIPLIVKNGLAIIQVRIHDQGPFNLALATGLRRSWIARSTWYDLALPVFTETSALSANDHLPSTPTRSTLQTVADDFAADRRFATATWPVNYARVEQLQVTEQATFPHLLYLQITDDFTKLSTDLGFTLHGILGYDFFKGQVVQLDYQHQRVRIFPKNAQAKTPISTDIPTAKFKIDGAGRSPVIQDVLINGVKLKAMVDTWQPDALTVSPQARKALQLPELNPPVQSQAGSITKLQIGELVATEIKAVFHGKDSRLDNRRLKYDVILGSDFLKNYAVTFDYAKHQLHLQQ